MRAVILSTVKTPPKKRDLAVDFMSGMDVDWD